MNRPVIAASRLAASPVLSRLLGNCAAAITARGTPNRVRPGRTCPESAVGFRREWARSGNELRGVQAQFD
jgi:hypothetical protein